MAEGPEWESRSLQQLWIEMGEAGTLLDACICVQLLIFADREGVATQFIKRRQRRRAKQKEQLSNPLFATAS